jgi:hypothetical protein
MSDATVPAIELAAFHRRWLDEVRQHLAPACAPHAGFWDRWAAVRYLADPFAEPYSASGELFDALLESLDPGIAGRLADDRTAIDQLRQDFDRIGRERGNAVAAAAIACSLLATLQRWCRGLEDAIRAVGPERLSSRAIDALARLTRAGAVTPS